MRRLCLTSVQADTLIQHALNGRFDEVCGVIAGRVNELGDGHAEKLIPVPNVAANPRYAYVMDVTILSRVLPELAHEGLETLVFYHSHPKSDPTPSLMDIEQATFPDSAYLIIGLKQGRVSLAAWRIRAGRVMRMPLYVGDLPPDALFPDDEALSDTQRAAVILSAVLAFAILIVLSLSLLPPAPPIPN